MRRSRTGSRHHRAGAGLTSGQWLKYPTDGLPRNADGTLNRNAPTPRLPDGQARISPASGTPANRNRCCRARGAVHQVRHRDRRLAARRQPRPQSAGGGLPYKPEVAKLADDAPRRRQPRRSARALPARQPAAALDAAAPHQGASTRPKLLALLYEVNAMYRQIFIDGRPFPADMNPTWNGYSVGALGRRHARGARRAASATICGSTRGAAR